MLTDHFSMNNERLCDHTLFMRSILVQENVHDVSAHRLPSTVEALSVSMNVSSHPPLQPQFESVGGGAGL